MREPFRRPGLLLGALALLGPAALLAAWSVPATAQTCFNAYFEMQPSPLAHGNVGWVIPESGTWTEVWPNGGRLHPQYAFNDYDLDGIIDHLESFSEAPGGAPWYVARAGTLYHLTPIELLEEGGWIPAGDPLLAWSEEFWFVTEIRSDGRQWFVRPDTLIVLQPSCCERMGIVDHIAGGVVGNGPPALFGTVGTGMGGRDWFLIDSKTCGLWVGPELATPATRSSWGRLKTIAR